MDKRNNAIRFLVVTPNVVVGEDLREALTEHGGADVEVHGAFDEEWGAGYQLAIFGVPVEIVLGDARVRNLHSSGTQIVVFDGDFPSSVLEGTGVLPLSRPFVTDDIKTLLQDTGLLAHGKT